MLRASDSNAAGNNKETGDNAETSSNNNRPKRVITKPTCRIMSESPKQTSEQLY